MRISTNTIFDKGTARMGELQTSLARVQQQVSTGRKLLSPSDDPVASARALEVSNAQEINAKFAVNRRNAKDSLSMSEGALQGVTKLMQDVKGIVVQAGSSALTNSERQFLATELQGRLDELVGLANTRDGVGNYVFAGYQNATKPFSATANGAAYAGDQGEQQLQVHTGRFLEIAQNGHELFERIGSSHTFVSAAATTPPNTGTATISKGAVVDVAQLTGARYDIVFADDGAGGFTYAVNNLDAGTSTAPAAWTGGPITFDGMEFTVSAGVAAGDTFEIRPTGNQSVFTTMKELIGLLQTPANSATDKAKLQSGLSIANTNMDKALDHMLTARAAIGSSLKEIDSLDSLGEDLNIQFATTLAELQDLDYVQAITDLTKQQVALQAAQQSFMKVTSLSLFNYMS